jgi:hypothetical protein
LGSALLGAILELLSVSTWAAVSRAAKGSIQAATEIADRTEGRPPKAIAVSGGLDIAFSSEEELMERIKVLSDRIRGGWPLLSESGCEAELTGRARIISGRWKTFGTCGSLSP